MKGDLIRLVRIWKLFRKQKKKKMRIREEKGKVFQETWLLSPFGECLFGCLTVTVQAGKSWPLNLPSLLASQYPNNDIELSEWFQRQCLGIWLAHKLNGISSLSDCIACCWISSFQTQLFPPDLWFFRLSLLFTLWAMKIYQLSSCNWGDRVFKVLF